jgi:hypothetical protein
LTATQSEAMNSAMKMVWFCQPSNLH